MKDLRDGDLAFRFTANTLSLDFLATMGEVGHRDIERLRNPADLARWIEQAVLQGGAVLVSPEDLQTALTFREALRRFLRQLTSGAPVDKALVDAINGAARRPLPRPELSADARRVSYHAEAPVSATLSAVARDLLTLIATDQVSRIKQCADPTCNMHFLDQSRANTRIWCAVEGRGCGNKAKKRAFRQRIKERA